MQKKEENLYSAKYLIDTVRKIVFVTKKFQDYFISFFNHGYKLILVDEINNQNVMRSQISNPLISSLYEQPISIQEIIEENRLKDNESISVVNEEISSLKEKIKLDNNHSEEEVKQIFDEELLLSNVNYGLSTQEIEKIEKNVIKITGVKEEKNKLANEIFTSELELTNIAEEVMEDNENAKDIDNITTNDEVIDLLENDSSKLLKKSDLNKIKTEIVNSFTEEIRNLFIEKNLEYTKEQNLTLENQEKISGDTLVNVIKELKDISVEPDSFAVENIQVPNEEFMNTLTNSFDDLKKVIIANNTIEKTDDTSEKFSLLLSKLENLENEKKEIFSGLKNEVEQVEILDEFLEEKNESSPEPKIEVIEKIIEVQDEKLFKKVLGKEALIRLQKIVIEVLAIKAEIIKILGRNQIDLIKK